jgi:SagB-type dehydrogenase family enzyme
MKANSLKLYTILIILIAFSCPSFSQKQDTIKLLAPNTTGGKPLMQVLKERKTNRDIKEGELTNQQLSDLLWAACGVNRPDGRRTAPTAMNDQEIDVYVALKKGLYLYEAKQHILIPILAEDVRGKMGKQKFTGDAAAMLIYVADYKKMGDASDADKDFYSATDAGYVSQNVYLYCASVNLATVVLGWIDRDEISKTLNLRKDQKIILSQCVGIPAK